MKILHFLVTDKLSGAENVMLSILRSLKDGNEVYYVSPEGPVRKFVEEAGVNFIPADTDSIPEIKRIYKEVRPDIVHACDPRMSFKCALAGIPFIAHLHNNCPWLKKLSLNSIALLYAIKKAKAVVTVSDSIEKEYIFRNALKKKLYMIPNVVDRERVETMAKEPFGGMYDIIFIGRMNEQKRPLLFLELVSEVSKKVPGVTAAMVGEGELLDEVREKLEKDGIKNVSLLGFQPNPYKIINNSKINVFTSYYEGFGLVAVESMILSKPVLGYAVGGLAGIITEDSGFLCRNNDEMAEKAVMLLSDKAMYERLSSGAKENSFRFTDTDGYTKKIKDLYDKVIAE
ncbi:MAG: glycosyltransferase [Ruminococcaceae bacterium]|nr:glycosyltransferase [Oscillospiraceae bacterium]